MDRIDLVLCKTEHALRLFSWPGVNSVLAGFISRDLLEAEVPRERRFIHVAGMSYTKNTRSVYRAWTEHGIDVPLLIVSRRYIHELKSTGHVQVVRQLPTKDLIAEMNRALFHLCPSQAEGWGHYIHEAMSCGAIVATTNAEPMTGYGTPRELLIEPMSREPQKLGFYRQSLRGASLYEIPETLTPESIAATAQRCYSMSEEQVKTHRLAARCNYEANMVRFRQTFPHLVMQAMEAIN